MGQTRYRGTFRAGDVLAKSFGIWARNLVPFTLLSCVVYSPLIAYTASVATRPLTEPAVAQWDQIVTIGGHLLGIVVAGALIYGVFEQLRGQPARLVDSLAVGVKRLLPCLAVGILAGLMMVVLLFICLWVTLRFAPNPLVVLVATIPAIWVWCVLYVAVPVAVVERPGIVASLNRSAELTAGNRGSIFLLSLVLIVFGILIGIGAGLAVEPGTSAHLWTTLFITILLGALQAVTSAVAYHDLRVTREGIGIDELVSVFA